MLRNRFLSVYALAFVAGLAGMLWTSAVWGAISFIFLPILCAAAILPVFFLRKRCPAVCRCVFLVTLGLLCGGTRLMFAGTGEAYEPFAGRDDTVVGSVVESASYDGGTWRVIRVQRSRIAIPKGTLVKVNADTSLPVHVGDRVTVTLSDISLPDAYQRADGASLVANGWILSAAEGTGWESKLLSNLRQACEQLYAPYGQEGMAQALLIRERSALQLSTTQAYRNAGLSHLLAISGLHLAIYMDLFYRIIRRMGMPRWGSVSLLLLLLLGFCAMTAWTPSVLRAAVMLGMLLAGEFLVHRVDRLTTLFSALLLLLLLDPYALLSVNLQLSFLACLGLMLLQNHVGEIRYRIRRKHGVNKLMASAAGSVLIYCSVLLFTFPIMTFSFGTVAYLSPLTNLLVLPLFVPLLTLLLLSVIAYFLLPPIAPLLAFLPGVAFRLLDGILTFLDRVNVGSAHADPHWMVLPVLLAVCAILSALLSKKHTFRLYWSFSAAFAVTLAVGLVLG